MISLYSCDDAINSDDNVYTEMNGDYDIYYSTLNKTTEEGFIIKSSIDGKNKEVWRDSSIFLFPAVDNRLLIYNAIENKFDINNNSPKLQYSIFNFNNNNESFPFQVDEIKEHLKLLNENKVIACNDITGLDRKGSASIIDLNNKTKIEIANSSCLKTIIPSPDGSTVFALNLDPHGYFIFNSDGSNKQKLNLKSHIDSGSIFVQSWTHDNLNFLCSKFDFDKQSFNGTFIKYNIENHQKTEIKSLDKHIFSSACISPQGDKIAFITYPGGLSIMDKDGSNLKVLRNIFTEEHQDLQRPIIEWSPDGKYILCSKMFSSKKGDILMTGLEVINVQTGEYTTIESNDIVTSATWIEK